MKKVSAWDRTDVLMVKLASAGWGDLAGPQLRGLRHILRGLVDCLPFASGQGFTTSFEVATKSGYSTRWVNHVLGELEALGLIEWRRGGVVNGKPEASFFRILKGELVNLIHAARDKYAAVVAEHRARIRAGIEALKTKRLLRSRRSVHVELGAHHSPLQGEVSSSLSERATSNYPKQLIPKGALAQTGGGWITHEACQHGNPVGKTPNGQWMCKQCRHQTAMEAIAS